MRDVDMNNHKYRNMTISRYHECEQFSEKIYIDKRLRIIYRANCSIGLVAITLLRDK